jgi:predicted transcriptional regulator
MSTFQLLLKSSSTRREAMDVMDDDMFSVPAFCTVGNLIKLLELTENRQINFPIVQDMKSMKIVGSVKRRALFACLYQTFEKVKKIDDLRKLLPIDAENYDLMTKKEDLEKSKNMRGILKAFRQRSANFSIRSFRRSDENSSTLSKLFNGTRSSKCE